MSFFRRYRSNLACIMPPAQCGRSFANCSITPAKKTPCGRLFLLERVRGIEPPYSAWEADVLPMNYTRRLGFLYYSRFFRNCNRNSQQLHRTVRMPDCTAKTIVIGGAAAAAPPGFMLQSNRLLPPRDQSFVARYRKVTTWPLVQVASGPNLSADRPLVTSFSTAHATASR